MSENICACNEISKEKILEAIEAGATTVEEVGKATLAGTGCGSCQWTIEQLLEKAAK